MTIRLHFLLLVVIPFSTVAQDYVYPDTDEELIKAFYDLPWELDTGQYEIEPAHALYTLRDDFLLLRGEPAKHAMFLLNGVQFPDTTAFLLGAADDDQIVLAYFKSGYVDNSDWNDLDANDLLETMQELTQAANTERVSNGFAPMEVIGWISEPTYQEENNVVFWAISGREGDNSFQNYVALELGRHGFTRVTWVPGRANPKENFLMAALESYDYQDGARYQDFTQGDLIAATGLAALVAVTAGGNKTSKGVVGGLLAAALILLKKFAIILFLPFIFFWNKLKSCFRQILKTKKSSIDDSNGSS